MSSNRHTVELGPYAKRHFCKSFSKKYKQARDKTLQSIQATLVRIHKADQIPGLTMIHRCDTGSIYKYEFRIYGSNKSARAGGNRCILYRNHTDRVTLLLVYGKEHVGSHHETVRWEKEIKENYVYIKKQFPHL